MWSLNNVFLMRIVNWLTWWVDPFVCLLCRIWASFTYCTLLVCLSLPKQELPKDQKESTTSTAAAVLTSTFIILLSVKSLQGCDVRIETHWTPTHASIRTEYLFKYLLRWENFSYRKPSIEKNIYHKSEVVK